MLEGYIEGKGKEHQSSGGCQSISTLCILISFAERARYLGWFRRYVETRQIFAPLIILCRILGWNQVSRNFWDSKSRWVLVHFHWLSTKVNSLTVCFPSPPLLVIIRREMQFYYVGNPSILELPDYLKTFQVNLCLGRKIYNTFIVWGISIIDE